MKIQAFEMNPAGKAVGIGEFKMIVMPREGELLSLRVGAEIIRFSVEKVIHHIENNAERVIRVRLARVAVPAGVE